MTEYIWKSKGNLRCAASNGSLFLRLPHNISICNTNDTEEEREAEESQTAEPASEEESWVYYYRSSI